MARSPKLGLVLPIIESPVDGRAPSFREIVELAQRAEQIGFDTVWLPDELIYRLDTGSLGWWECFTMAGAVAARTSRIGIGTWVVAANRRNPGTVVKAADTLDEISGGRFTLGVGAGSMAGTEAFGFASDHRIGRYEEFLDVMMPLLRDGTSTFAGTYHRTDGAEVRPRGPRAGRIPVMLGAHGERTMRLAVQHADLWSGYATESSHPDAFTDMLALLDRTCEQLGRDPATLERSLGLDVETGDDKLVESLGWGDPISGSTAQIVETLAAFADRGVTRVEMLPWPGTVATVEALAPVVETLRSDR
jgi:alkanesulfonate monooxygenase SsuD/methylene tetrahydromethanopterin reductase-like flavin-dependent oxidoreductase (luciferase family)